MHGNIEFWTLLGRFLVWVTWTLLGHWFLEWVTWTLLGQVSCAGNLNTAWTGFSTGFLYIVLEALGVLLVNWVVIVGLYSIGIVM